MKLHAAFCNVVMPKTLKHGCLFTNHRNTAKPNISMLIKLPTFQGRKNENAKSDEKENCTYSEHHLLCLFHSCFARSQLWERDNTNCKSPTGISMRLQREDSTISNHFVSSGQTKKPHDKNEFANNVSHSQSIRPTPSTRMSATGCHCSPLTSSAPTSGNRGVE
jgi:hypothetical protein